jgi:hypothetical protein
VQYTLSLHDALPIYNTITYFTRQHIAKDTNESLELEEAYDELEENATTDIENKIKSGEIDAKEVEAAAKKAMSGDSKDLALLMAGFGKMFEGNKEYYKDAEADDAAHIAALEKDMKDDKRSSIRNESLNENLTPLQQYIYDYEVEISDKEFADAELKNIKKLNTPRDVYNYYAVYRGWEQDKDLKNELKNIFRQVTKNFSKTIMKESLEILKMKKLAGLLAEGEYAKALLKENQVNNKYVVKDEKLSDEDYGFYYIDQQKAFDYLKQFNNSEVSAKQFIKDDEGWGEFEQYINNIEQMSDKELEDAMRQEMSYYFFSKPDEI